MQVKIIELDLYLTYVYFTRYNKHYMIKRNIIEIIHKFNKSLLLLGPRQTGKSTLIQSLNPDLTINLTKEEEYLQFAAFPGELENRINAKHPKSVFIDEVQRLPSLLNTVQFIIDSNKSLRFYLTGSSARKLKRGQANLLPGRIHTFSLGPLCSSELHYAIDIQKALGLGTLPGIYTEEELSAKKTLKSYCSTYLKEEIQAEALMRNLEGFARFLFVVAATATEFLDYEKFASQAQINRQSAVRYFEILEDTLIVYRVTAFSKSKRRRLIQHPRYFFFDNGVLNSLLNNFTPSLDRIGFLLENLFLSQLMASAFSKDIEINIHTYRTEHGAEIDFIVQLNQELWAIEVKASTHIGKTDLSGFQSFSEFYKHPYRKLVAYLGKHPKKIEDIDILPWQEALKKMGL